MTHVNNCSNNGRRTSLLRTGVGEELLSMYHTISCKSCERQIIMSRVIIVHLPCSLTPFRSTVKIVRHQRLRRAGGEGGRRVTHPVLNTVSSEVLPHNSSPVHHRSVVRPYAHVEVFRRRIVAAEVREWVTRMCKVLECRDA